MYFGEIVAIMINYIANTDQHLLFFKCLQMYKKVLCI